MAASRAHSLRDYYGIGESKQPPSDEQTDQSTAVPSLDELTASRSLADLLLASNTLMNGMSRRPLC